MKQNLSIPSEVVLPEDVQTALRTRAPEDAEDADDWLQARKFLESLLRLNPKSGPNQND